MTKHITVKARQHTFVFQKFATWADPDPKHIFFGKKVPAMRYVQPTSNVFPKSVTDSDTYRKCGPENAAFGNYDDVGMTTSET